MKTGQFNDCIERRQLDFIQRVGRIGYWEYDPATQSMYLPDASLDLLASIVGGTLALRESEARSNWGPHRASKLRPSPSAEFGNY